jgi:cytochrome oxidase Cu insertion factor (SCO1/SenC/PrrC family)
MRDFQDRMAAAVRLARIPRMVSRRALRSSPIRSMALAAAVVLLASPTARSQGQPKPAPEEQTGPKVGAKAPKFTLKDQQGRERSLDEFLGKGKVALVFYRSADW